jgi:hypothetical protein
MADRFMAVTTGTVTWNSTATWSATDGGATGASIPVSGDTVYIIRGNATIPGQDLSAVVLANLYVSFQGTIGSLGSPFKIGLADGADSRFSGDHGDVYISPFIAANTPPTTIGKISFLGNGFGNIVCGAMCRVVFLSTFDGLFTVNAIGNTEIQSNSTAGASSCSIVAQSGQVSCARATNNVSVLSGVVTISGVGGIAGTTMVYPNAILNYQSTGTIANLTTFPSGVAQSSGANGAFTVSKSTKWGGSTMFDSSIAMVTYTQQTEAIGSDPRF